MRTSRAILLKSVADVAARGTSVISFPLIARHAGPDGYGAYGQITALASLVIPLTSLGITNAVVRFYVPHAWTSQLMRSVLRTSGFLLATALTIALVVYWQAADLGALLLDWPNSTALFQAGAVLLIAGTFELFVLEILRSRDWLMGYALFQLAQTLLTVLAVAVLLPSGYGVVELIVAMCVIKFALIGAASVMMVAKRVTLQSTQSDISIPISKMVRFGFPITVSGIGLVLVNVGDRGVIGHYLPAEALGRYSAVYVLAGLLTLASGPLFLPAYPRLMQASLSGRKDLMEADVWLFHRYLTLSLVPMALFLILIVEPVMSLMGGSGFQVAPTVVALIVAGIFIDQWNGLAHYVLMCNDRTFLLQNTWLGFGLANVLANIVAVPIWGLHGAALVTLLSFIGLNAVVLTSARRHLPVMQLYGWKLAIRCLIGSLAAAGLGALLLGTLDGGAVAIVIAGLAFWVCYAAILIVWRQIGANDLTILKTAIWSPRRSAVSESEPY